jgi:hypothetical protein
VGLLVGREAVLGHGHVLFSSSGAGWGDYLRGGYLPKIASTALPKARSKTATTATMISTKTTTTEV